MKRSVSVDGKKLIESAGIQNRCPKWSSLLSWGCADRRLRDMRSFSSLVNSNPLDHPVDHATWTRVVWIETGTHAQMVAKEL